MDKSCNHNHTGYQIDTPNGPLKCITCGKIDLAATNWHYRDKKKHKIIGTVTSDHEVTFAYEDIFNAINNK